MTFASNLSNGKPGWTTTGFLSVNHGPAKAFYAAGHSATGLRNYTFDVAR